MSFFCLRSHQRWIMIGVSALAALATLLPALAGCSQPAPAFSSQPRALILDQLSGLYSNPGFIQSSTDALKTSGFEVDVISGAAVNVEFWRDLPARDYKVIILREHAGVKEELVQDSRIWMFTNEPYTKWRYVLAQVRNQVTGAKTREEDSSMVFAVNTRFVNDCIRGEFPGTIIINMGCAAFYSDEIARAFISRDAAAYIAWDASVGIHYVDAAAAALIDKICRQGKPLGAAVSETMQEFGPDPDHGAVLRLYPASSAALKVR